MLTVLELSQLIGKSENVIRYWITHDPRFAETYWIQKTIKIRNKSGWYDRTMNVCDEGNITRIAEYLASKKTNKTTKKQCWSDLAIHCFERKMICNGCTFQKYCREFAHPPMKAKVLELVTKYGEPR